MTAKSITVSNAADDVLASLRAFADTRGAAIETQPLQNGVRVRLAGGGLNVYPSKGGGCKIVFDQPDAPLCGEVAILLGGKPSTTASPSKSADATLSPAIAGATCWIGSDESGKGDYFGPLVVAAVAVTSADWRGLQTLGVRDSKALSDRQAAALASQIRDAYPHEVIVVSPKRYNELWTEMGSVNKLLAWAHARAIENLLERSPDASAAVADQFGDESLIRDALFRRGRQVQLVQMPRAERDPAVAAASILARAEFLRRLDQAGRAVGVRLPKGASSAVEAVARALVAQHGPQIIDDIAKRHFRTTQRVI